MRKREESRQRQFFPRLLISKLCLLHADLGTPLYERSLYDVLFVCRRFLLHGEQFNAHCRCELRNNEEHSKPGQGLIVDPGFTLRYGSQLLCLHSQPTPSLFS